jgi:hypothetical protein
LPSIPVLFSLEQAGVRFRAGQVVMFTGRPKAGKSNFAQWLVSQWNLPTLYYSLDMDAFTAAVRQAAIVTGHKLENISAAMEQGAEGWYEDELVDSDIAFCFDTTPELPDIQAELDAYVELNDIYPSVIVIDNLLNIECGEGGLGDYKHIMKQLQSLARKTGALVIVLHHAREGTKDVTRPPTAAETDNKINQIPEVLLGLAKSPVDDRFEVAVLYQRNGGRSDPNAEHPAVIWADFGTMQFSSSKPIAAPSWGGWSQDETDDD